MRKEKQIALRSASAAREKLRLRLLADRVREQIAWSSAPLPQRWDPGVGGQLVGQLTAWDEDTTSRGGTFKIAMVRDEVGDFFSVALLWTVLKSEFERVDPQIGEMIAISRLPDRTSRKERIYRDYKLKVYREGDLAASANEPQPTPPGRDWSIPKVGYLQ